jgi:hypothetical protein
VITFRILVIVAACVAVCAPNASAEQPEFDEASVEFFEKSVRPLLVKRCYECHSGAAEEPKGGLRLDSRAAIFAGGDTGPAIDPASPKQSLLLDAINYGDIYQMPPKSKMPEEEIAILTRWIELGAPWPKEDANASLAREEFNLQARKQSHWAWRPVERVSPPAVKNSTWAMQSLDAFILAPLEEKGIFPAAPADRRTLLRRLHFDLVGLPPSPEEVEAFVHDEDPKVVEKAVDKLLDSPHFGERWGRHWLDLVRYAESRGHEFDYDVPGAWHYRDYVIRALNADVPYDQFVLEHVAGDLLPQPRLNPEKGFNESILGTGFWFFGEWVHSPVDIRQDEADRVDNMLDVASKTFLGMTLACARCHDHKFDAISQRDYYAMAGFLKSSTYRQARFESLEHNARMAQEWSKLQSEFRPKLAKEAAERRATVVSDFARYLLAARDVARQRSQGASSNVVVGSNGQGLNSDILSKWALHLEKAKTDPRDPLHVWAVAGEEMDFVQKRSELLSKAEAQQRRAEESLRDVQIIVDYRKPRTADWIVDGPAFGAGPAPAGAVMLGATPDAPLVKVAEYGAARRDSFWNGLKLAAGAQGEPGRSGAWDRAGRTLRTPTFTIEAKNVYYLVRGAGQVYAVVDSHRINNGPLHGSLIHSFQNLDDPKWIAQPLDRYLGHTAHLEFSPKDDAPLEILLVVQADNPPGEPLDHPSPLLMKALAESDSAGELAQNCQAAIEEVLKKLGEDRISESPAAGDEARLANWLLEHPELTVAGSAELGEASKDFVARRIALAEKIMANSHTAPAMWDGSGADEFLLIRGNPRTPGDIVPRRFLEALAGADPLECESGSGRLELARRIASAENPLTARVMVNRVWHHLFGRGIVASVDNFGVLGEPPTHPELLDHLATQFVDEGWSLKRLIRSIVLSRTYQMASVSDEAAGAADPANRLFHRMPVRRLEGEAIRDAILAVSGRLDPTLYGPSVPVHLTPFMQGRGRPAQSGPLDGAGRRSIYGAVRRNFLSPMMLAFDAPAPFSTMGRRNVSNVPAQALILMNYPFVVEQARLWAERELAAKDLSPEEHLERLYLAALARPPSEEEAAAAMAFLDQQAAALGPPATRDDSRAWADLCHALLNLKEFIFVR